MGGGLSLEVSVAYPHSVFTRTFTFYRIEVHVCILLCIDPTSRKARQRSRWRFLICQQNLNHMYKSRGSGTGKKPKQKYLTIYFPRDLHLQNKHKAKKKINSKSRSEEIRNKEYTIYTGIRAAFGNEKFPSRSYSKNSFA